MRAFGSPDTRQIDGLGGADPLTSKVAVIKPSAKEDVDVDYTSGQVGIYTGTIDYSVNCGNLSAGVVVFAVDEGLVRPEGPVTIVRIYNTTTCKLITSVVPVVDGRAATTGHLQIAASPVLLQ